MAIAMDIYTRKAEYSKIKLTELSNRLGQLPEVKDFPNLMIYGSGSFGRLEASEYSDIDMFFLCVGDKTEIEEPRTKELRLFGKVIDIIDTMNFPKFSNDCQYLVRLHTADILSHLGSPTDDHENYFTARMLLLLESHCLYNEAAYEKIIASIVNAYFEDFPDHVRTFQVTFLLNDICRFWKTLLLNYEHKRKTSPDTPERKIDQKVRNFKLKFSRMTTCFASIAALGSYKIPVNADQVIEMTKLTPIQRLESIPTRLPEVSAEVTAIIDRYAWFLKITSLPIDELNDHFSDKEKRIEMFKNANEYGDLMFGLLQAVDKAIGQDNGSLLRYLVI